MVRRAREQQVGYGKEAPVLCDINVLVAASRPDHIHHALTRDALSAHFARRGPFAIASQCFAGFIRVVTNRKIFNVPTSLSDALAVVDQYRSYPAASPAEPGTGHWLIFRELLLATGITGGATSDVWHAALAIEHGCEWWTLDRDFARFPGLKLRNLLNPG